MRSPLQPASHQEMAALIQAPELRAPGPSLRPLLQVISGGYLVVVRGIFQGSPSLRVPEVAGSQTDRGCQFPSGSCRHRKCAVVPCPSDLGVGDCIGGVRRNPY